MEPAKASRTAVLVAAYRARGTSAVPPLCEDPWASRLTRDEGEALTRQWDAVQPHLGLWIGVRTRYIDERLCRLTAPDGLCRQVVVLGAGLDTRAARLPRTGVRYFEVDRPESQHDKLERLRALSGYPVEAATYVACEFSSQDFLDELVRAGFDPQVPAFVIWEGVTYYLPEAVVRGTLRRIADACHPMTTVIFDHVGRKLVERRTRDEADLGTLDGVERLGEPFLWGTNDVLPVLFEEGYRHVHVRSFDEACLNQTGTYDRDRRFRFQWLAEASRQAADP